MTIVLTWYQLRKLAGSLRPSADSAAKAAMEPTTAADNRPSPALLLFRPHRAPVWIRSSVLTHILTLLIIRPASFRQRCYRALLANRDTPGGSPREDAA